MLQNIRKISNMGVLVFLAFLITDLIWLSALPILNLSYGPLFPSIFLFSTLRLLVLKIWFGLKALSKRSKVQLKFRICLLLLLIPNLFLTGFGIYGYYIEPFQLTLSQVEIPIQGLEQRIRIVQLSDLHIERITPREMKLPDFVNNLNPDLILISGDFLSYSDTSDAQSIAALRDIGNQFKARLGIFGVNGNVDTPELLRAIFFDQKISILNDQVVRIPMPGKDLSLIGLSYNEKRNDDVKLEEIMAKTFTGDFTLLLYHTPDLAYTARDAGVDLYLAGHTHGGQVRLPFYGAIFTKSKFGKTFEMGMYQLGKTTLYVSRGSGSTGGLSPRIRFLAPPEIVVIDLVSMK